MTIYNIIEDNDGDLFVYNFADEKAARNHFAAIFADCTEDVDDYGRHIDENCRTLEECWEEGEAYFGSGHRLLKKKREVW